AGEDVSLFVEASGLPEPAYQWQFFGTNLPGATTWTLTLRNVRSSAAGDYTVIVSNSLNSIVSVPIALSVIAPSRTAGSPDISFYTGLGPNDRVNAVAVQPDRKIIIGGAFTEVSGLSRNRIARLLYDGAVDPSFDPGAGANGVILALAIQADGKILAAGSFTNFNHLARNRIVRLQSNGVVDPAFNPVPGPDGDIFAVAFQPNGQVLIGGTFTEVDGQARGLARLNTNGTLDTAFVPALLGFVNALKLRPDGKIIAGGSFYSGTNATQFNVARLLPNGSLDPSFVSFGANGTVFALDFASSNRLALGGEFFTLNGAPRTRVGRLEESGAADLTFTNAGVNGLVSALSVEPDDKIVIGGQFRTIGNFPYVGLVGRNRLARMNKDGSVDLSFASGAGVQGGSSYIDEYGSLSELATVLALAREADGKILVGGDFTTVNEIARPYIARVFGREASAAVAVHKGQGNVELIWDTGILQVANQITGPWTDLPNAQSPLLYPTGGAQQFFRLKFN
ncbi:MAG TPA: immunoglobulin domain-containing protein, partial [Verrucomicrobiae bacterium]